MTLTILTIFTITVNFCFFYVAIILIRISKVTQYRQKILQKIAESPTREEDLFEFSKVTKEDMIFKFWKRLKSFYKNQSFNQ